MSVKLRIDKPKKYWWSSTSIWTVPGSDPTGPQGSPNVGETTFIWAKVENLGDVADEFITVKFYVGNPSTVMTPTTTTTIGTSFASIPLTHIRMYYVSYHGNQLFSIKDTSVS